MRSDAAPRSRRCVPSTMTFRSAPGRSAHELRTTAGIDQSGALLSSRTIVKPSGCSTGLSRKWKGGTVSDGRAPPPPAGIPSATPVARAASTFGAMRCAPQKLGADLGAPRPRGGR